MKHILSFLAGVLIVVLLATTPKTQHLFTVKPTTPSSVLVKGFYSSGNNQSDAVSFIKQGIKLGYIVKTINMTQYEVIVVMEKY